MSRRLPPLLFLVMACSACGSTAPWWSQSEDGIGGGAGVGAGNGGAGSSFAGAAAGGGGIPFDPPQVPMTPPVIGPFLPLPLPLPDAGTAPDPACSAFARCFRDDGTRCGLVHDEGCHDVNCGGCPSSELCTARPSGGVCVLCREGAAGLFPGDFNARAGEDTTLLRGITEITGTLELSYNAAQLADMSCLRRVHGDVLIGWSDDILQDAMRLTGLGALERVDGSLSVLEDGYLHSLDGLSGLISVGGTLELNLGNLDNLHGLERLQSVGGDLNVGGTSISDLAALSSLTHVGGTLSLYSAQITDLSGLSQLTMLGGLALSYIDTLTSLDGLAGVQAIPGSITLYSLPALTSVDGLRSLHTIGGSLYLSSLPALTDLSPLSGLQQLGTLGLQDTAVTGLQPFAQLTHIDGSVALQNNPALSSLAGLDALEEIGASLFLSGNFSSLAGLGALETIGSDLEIHSCPELTQIDGLGKLTQVGNNLQLLGLSKLASLQGLHSLTRVGGLMRLYVLPALHASTGPGALQYARGLWLQDTQLTELAGLTALTDTELLFIGGNPQLTSLQGLRSLQNVTGRLSIYHNPSLPSCQAEALATRVQRSCSCPPGTGSTCMATCPPGVNCLTCAEIGYCLCQGTCDCNDNDAAAVCN